MEHSGTEEEELILTMQWKTGLGGRVGNNITVYKSSTQLSNDYEDTVISWLCQEDPCRLGCSPKGPTSWPHRT